jgi:hypothetical protein
MKTLVCEKGHSLADFAIKLVEIPVPTLREHDVRADVDLRNEKIDYKVREHSLAHVPLILAAGQRDMDNQMLRAHSSERCRHPHDQRGLPGARRAVAHCPVRCAARSCKRHHAAFARMAADSIADRHAFRFAPPTVYGRAPMPSR